MGLQVDEAGNVVNPSKKTPDCSWDRHLLNGLHFIGVNFDSSFTYNETQPFPRLGSERTYTWPDSNAAGTS
jgi:hypothetical protein